MNPEAAAELDEIIQLIHSLIQKKGMPETLARYSQQYPSLEKLVTDLLALCEFSNVLSQGDLAKTLDMRGYFPGALKALQSNLRHLTWQTSMVAAGDYSQHVDFMGDFSMSFNTMIARLKEATENEQRYIAELKKSKELIKESERKYRLIAENTDDIIWLLDRDMNILYISPSVEKVLGYAPDEFTASKAGDTPLPFLHTVILEKQAVFDKEDKPLIIENEQSCKDKKIIWTESFVSSVKNDEGCFIGFLGVTRDISERKKNEDLLYQAYERRIKSDFFNRLLTLKNCNDVEVLELARQHKLYLPRDFSLLFLAVENLQATGDDEKNQHRRQQIIDALVDYLSRKENTIAWETGKGIGIINAAAGDDDRKSKELELAREYARDMLLYFPNLKMNIGIANYASGLVSFANRLHNAETAVVIGRKVWAEQCVYHYEDCGIFQVLAPFAMSEDAGSYIQKTLGPLLEHDAVDGTDLVITLEKILSGLTFKEIGAQLFLHHKTIQLRKQRIEQILNVSLDSHEARMVLSTAIQLHKIAAL